MKLVESLRRVAGVQVGSGVELGNLKYAVREQQGNTRGFGIVNVPSSSIDYEVEKQPERAAILEAYKN